MNLPTQTDNWLSNSPGHSARIDSVTSKPQGDYSVRRRETLAEVPGLRIRLLTLLKGEKVPWHFHSTTTDTFFCMQGPMRVLTRAPEASYTLYNGDTLAISPGTPHYVEGVGKAPCQFMIVQGIGKYDYVPLKD